MVRASHPGILGTIVAASAIEYNEEGTAADEIDVAVVEVFLLIEGFANVRAEPVEGELAEPSEWWVVRESNLRFAKAES